MGFWIRCSTTRPQPDSRGYPQAYSKMLVRPGNSYATGGGPYVPPNQPSSPAQETLLFQTIQDVSTKRISTLDYLRKAYVKKPGGLSDVGWRTCANLELDMKGVCIGSTHYYSTSLIYNGCPISNRANSPEGRRITCS